MRKIILTMVLVLTTSCSAVDTSITISEQAAPVSMTSYTESSYTVYTKESYTPSLLEPLEGCYLGAYVLSNSKINYSIEQYEQITRKPHAIYVYNMRLGDSFPYNWVLECVSSMKTPYIIVSPPNEYSVFQEELLPEAAKAFGELPVPIFVDFYPNPHKYTDYYNLYTDFYKKAYGIFKEHAPNTIFVLSADSEQVYDFNFYYPGDNYVDWLGISIYVPLYKGGVANARNYMKDLDYFYTMYQRKKPLIVSQLAFSSYSTKDHRYDSVNAAKRLADFYTALKTDYTRVKAVNYMDFNNIEGAPKNAERDNFSVTQNEIMLKSCQQQIKDRYFMSETKEISEKEKEIISIFRSDFTVMEDENHKYISQKALTEQQVKSINTPPVIINDEGYYSVETLEKNSINCTVDKDLRRIYLESIQL